MLECKEKNAREKLIKVGGPCYEVVLEIGRLEKGMLSSFV